MASEQMLKSIQSFYTDGYLAADFKLFGVPQTTEEAEIWMANYQTIRNNFFDMSMIKTEETARAYDCKWIKEVYKCIVKK